MRCLCHQLIPFLMATTSDPAPTHFSPCSLGWPFDYWSQAACDTCSGMVRSPHLAVARAGTSRNVKNWPESAASIEPFLRRRLLPFRRIGDATKCRKSELEMRRGGFTAARLTFTLFCCGRCSRCGFAGLQLSKRIRFPTRQERLVPYESRNVGCSSKQYPKRATAPQRSILSYGKGLT
jgi:hypothetical protein